MMFFFHRTRQWLQQKTDRDGVEHWLPGIQKCTDDQSEARALFATQHESYVTTVSSRDMAVALDQALFMFRVCQLRSPQTILDTGSGFSSYVFRKYTELYQPGGRVVSVDDNAQWLEKTRTYLNAQNCSADHVELWENFRQQSGHTKRYDLIFHDLGSMSMRAETLPYVLTLCSPQGFVILDDMHKPDYERQARRICKGAGFRVLSLRSFCLDRFFRFPAIALPPTL